MKDISIRSLPEVRSYSLLCFWRHRSKELVSIHPSHSEELLCRSYNPLESMPLQSLRFQRLYNMSKHLRRLRYHQGILPSIQSQSQNFQGNMLASRLTGQLIELERNRHM